MSVFVYIILELELILFDFFHLQKILFTVSLSKEMETLKYFRLNSHFFEREKIRFVV